MKTYQQLERITKGIANHRRIQMLELIGITPDLTLNQIAEEVNVNFKTASEHLRRLTLAGLVTKKHKGPSVLHKISKRGVVILKFLRTLE